MLDLKGPVSRVVEMAQFPPDKPYLEYLLDVAGRVVEIRTHIQDVFGGTSSSRFTYDGQGRVTLVTSNGKVVQEYEYKGKYLASAKGFGMLVTFQVKEDDQGGVHVTITSSKGVTSYSLDSKGRMVDAAANIARVINLGGVHGPVQCSLVDNDIPAVVATCVENGRPAARTFDSTRRRLTEGKYTYKFTEDSHGNWLTREAQPGESSRRTVRTVEYR